MTLRASQPDAAGPCARTGLRQQVRSRICLCSPSSGWLGVRLLLAPALSGVGARRVGDRRLTVVQDERVVQRPVDRESGGRRQQRGRASPAGSQAEERKGEAGPSP